MPSRISQAIVLVGEVTSGRPDLLPHPLTDIADRPLIDHVLDRIGACGLTDVLVVLGGEEPEAAAWAAPLSDHLRDRTAPRAQVTSRGPNDPLADAFHHPDGGPVLVVSAHALWLDGPVGAIDRLMATWDAAAMDALVLGVAVTKSFGAAGLGDLAMDPLGRVTALTGGNLAPHHNTGVHIVDPACLGSASSLMQVLRGAMARGRLFGLVHDGVWFHVGTQADLAMTREKLAEPEVRWVIS